MKHELEAQLEARCVARVEALGGLALKLVIPGVRGFPDRTVLGLGPTWFFETKRLRSGRVSAQQSLWFNRLEALGLKVWLIDNDADFEAALTKATVAALTYGR